MLRLEFGKAICYSGYRKGQSPSTISPTKEQIEEDIMILHNDGYKYLRMYDPNEHARRVLEVIHEKRLPMKCMIGIDSKPEVNNPDCPFEKQSYTEEQLKAHIVRNDEELEKLILLVKEFPDEVAAVSVGNENTPLWGAHMVSEDRLIRHAKRLKEALDKPVTFCEGLGEWKLLKKLPLYMDIISIHTYPYHIGTPVSEALSVNKQHLLEAKELFKDKQVVITELGWSSSTSSVEKINRATLENERRYINDIKSWVDESKEIVFIFEAFDELWKGEHANSSECNFGLYNEQRKRKF